MGDELTTNQGAPVPDNQNSLTAGRRGPVLLSDHHLLEKLAHLNRERIPERVIHARGATAFGVFRPEPGLDRYTRAHVFTRDKETPVAARFSTSTHARHSPETLREVRGFAVKFYTSQGNYDIVGNSLPVYFIRDAIRFPDLIHALKPDPVSGIQDATRLFDFLSYTPESTHMLIWLYSDRGIPLDYRHMQGFGVHTYVWINAKGEAHYVKYHWTPAARVTNLSPEEARSIQANDFSHATNDLYSTIRKGVAVEFDLGVQIMDVREEDSFAWDPLDVTKTWPEDGYPILPAGRMTLNRAPFNEFAENEQIAFSPSATIPGIELSADKLLQGRAFAYPDSQRYRLGVNYLQLPVNRPKVASTNQQQDGAMTFEFSSSPANYEPNHAREHLQAGGSSELVVAITGPVIRQRIEKTDDFTQPGQTWRGFDEDVRTSVIRNLGDELARIRDPKVVDAIAGFMRRADPLLGESIRRRARGDLPDAAAMLHPPSHSAPPAHPPSGQSAHADTRELEPPSAPPPPEPVSTA